MIQKELAVIEKSNALFANSLEGEALKKSRRVMVDCRRKLKREKFAFDDNPAAVLYGESQVGKSYLINGLLSVEGAPFLVKDGNGKSYDFIKEINPPGGGSESTSIVSRFSVNYEPINKDFPIKAVLLSPADIVLVLCDSFYNDVKKDHSLIMSADSIVSEVSSLKERLNGRHVQQSVLDEDDLLDMQDYFNENFSQQAGNIIDSHFFDEISLFISKAKADEWKDIFSILWNKNETFTSLFVKMVSEYEKLDFSGIVYLPIESVLCANGTVLDVNRLNEISTTGAKSETKVLLPGKTSGIDFPKSYLCALAAELQFGLQKELENNKEFLKNIDLLDFPGARARLTLPQNEIKNENIPELLKRGKVAYLFNKFSDTKKISILMLCVKDTQPGPLSMPEMLNNWVNKYVGKTPENRERFIEKSQVPPLFIIGTFFNNDLEYYHLQDRVNNTSSLSFRWEKRFETILARQLLNTETYEWFNNWTMSNMDFKNIFLLRDFNWSIRLFDGFREEGKETKEVDTPDYPGFRQKLHQSFLDYPFVQRHFENPAESWNSAASINKDGTQLIIEKLSIAAKNINIARIEKTRDELNEISQTVIDELKKHFHSDDKDETLQKAKNTAGKIQLKMAGAFSGDGIKLFGLMMKELMLDESDVNWYYHQILDDIEHRNQRNTSQDSILKMQVPPEPNDDVDSYFERARAFFNQTHEEFSAYLEERNIDLATLLRGTYMIKDDARLLAEKLLEYWLDNVRKNKHPVIWRILSDGNQQNPQVTPTLLMEIVNMYNQLFEKLNVAEKIAEKILRYTNRSSKAGIPYKIIADISAEYINKFVNTVGFELLDGSAIKALQQANTNVGNGNMLELKLDRNLNRHKPSVKDAFIKIHNLAEIVKKDPKELETLPHYRNYLLWAERLKIGFVYACDIPTYDAVANKKLGDIIKEHEAIGRY